MLFVQLSIQGFLLFIIFSAFLTVGILGQSIKPEPGSPCQNPITDVISCDTTNTLMACTLLGTTSPICNCVSGMYGLNYKNYSYTIDMEWNPTTRECVSLLSSVCNVVKGERNKFPLGGSKDMASFGCKNNMICHPSSNYPPEHGTCGGMGLRGFYSFIFFITLSVVIINKFY